MTAKAVLDVEVNLSSFERFEQLHSKYAAVNAKQPKIWADVGKEQAKITSNFERGVKALHEQAELALEELKARESEERVLGRSERHWASMANSSRSVSSVGRSMEASVSSASTSMLKWSGMLSGLGPVLSSVIGVATAGFQAAMALYDKSVGVAGNLGFERRTAQGLGMSIADHRAFGLDFSKVVDTDSFLGNVQEMQTDMSKAGPLWRAGVNPNGPLTQVATGYLDWARRQAVGASSVSQLGWLNQKWNTDIPIDTWMRLRSMPDDEYANMHRQFDIDRSAKGGLGIDDSAARRIQNFATQVRRADMQGDNIWERKVAREAGRLTDVSKGFVGLQRTLTDTKMFEWAMGKIDDGLKWMATTGIPDLEKTVEGTDAALDKFNKALNTWDEKYSPQATGGGARKWFDQSVLGEDDWNDSSSAPGLPPPMIRKRRARPSSQNTPGVAPGLDLSNIVGKDPTSWNRSPVSNTYASNRSSVNSTTNNYGARGPAGMTVNIVVPPGFSVNSTLSQLNAGYS